ncbi:hypothetical protein LINPERPRIM_LOCUS24511 [Linum perenne]
MHKNWGVQAAAKIWSLEDDVWLLECESLEAVRRVIALNRCRFGSVRIFLDNWTAGAGRSSCLEDQGLEWVVVRGIPLHLRSEELFRRIGELCGGFVEFDSQ